MTFSKQSLDAQLDDAIARWQPNIVTGVQFADDAVAVLTVQFPAIPPLVLGRVAVSLSMICESFIKESEAQGTRPPDAGTITALIGSLGAGLTLTPPAG